MEEKGLEAGLVIIVLDKHVDIVAQDDVFTHIAQGYMMS
jgi:hypothetical protein